MSVRNIGIFTLAILFVQIGYSQSLVVTGSNSVPSSDPCLQSHATLTVKNILTTDTLKVLCEKIIIDTTAGTQNNFCWGANCYSSTTYISTDYNTLDPGEGDSFDFGGYYDAYCDVASATIEYCFFPQSNPSDRSCITILYNGSSTSVFDKETFSKGFYPNPAREYTNISYDPSLQNLKMKIIDILGNVVKHIDIESQGHSIYVGDLNKGIYFGNLMDGDKLVSIEKLIVK